MLYQRKCKTEILVRRNVKEEGRDLGTILTNTVQFSHPIVSNSLSLTLGIISCQTSLSMGFSRQEHWSGLSFHPLGELPDPGVEVTSLLSPKLLGKFFTTTTTWEASKLCLYHIYNMALYIIIQLT